MFDICICLHILYTHQILSNHMEEMIDIIDVDVVFDSSLKKNAGVGNH